jgi:CRISPR-associated protein Cas5t
VGETNRLRHVGCRVTATLLNRPEQSVVLRTVWRVKKTPLGSPGNTRPDYQQLLSRVELVLWVDSRDESAGVTALEDRVRNALERPASVQRFGGLCLGESTHMVDEVNMLPGRKPERYRDKPGRMFLRAERGRLTLPVWVDHVGSAGTRYVTGDLKDVASVLTEPAHNEMPRIDPEGQQT